VFDLDEEALDDVALPIDCGIDLNRAGFTGGSNS
jgi:hypothetical protein